MTGNAAVPAAHGREAAKMAALPVNAACSSRAALTGNAAVPAAHGREAAKMAALPVNVPCSSRAALTGNAAVPAAKAVEFPKAMSDAAGHFASRFDTVAVTRHNLPHWGLDGVVVFVTFRLADSLPASILAKWQDEREKWIELHPEPWSAETEREYAAIFPNRMERWLDSGHGSCILARQDCMAVVSRALEHFNGVRYRLHSYVVMPNHVHMLFDLPKRDELPRVMHSWKSYTAKELNRLTGTAGSVWMRDYYDRIVRNGEHYGQCVAYIRKNAFAAARMAAFPVNTAVPAAKQPKSC